MNIICPFRISVSGYGTDPFVSQSPREFLVSHSLGQILIYAYTIRSMVKFQFLKQFSVDHLSHPVMPALVHFSVPFSSLFYSIL